MNNENERHKSGAAKTVPAVGDQQNPLPTSAESSAYELLTKNLSDEEARQVRQILNQWSRGDENSYPFQHALLTRAHWKVAAALPLEMAKIVESYRSAVDTSAQRIAQIAEVKVADLERVSAFAQILAKDVGILRKYAAEAIVQLETAARRYDQAAANFQDSQSHYLDARKGSEWLAFCVTSAFVAMLGIGVGFLASGYWPAAR